MTISIAKPGVASRSTSEEVRAALAAALCGARAPQSPPAVPPAAPVLNGLKQAAEQTTAAALIAVKTATTVAELAAVFSVLQPGRDASRTTRLEFWTERIGSTPLVDVSTDQVDAILAELEHEPGRWGRVRTGGTINRFRAAFASLVKFARKHRRLPRGWISPLRDLPQHKESPGRVRYLSADEEARLMAAAQLQRWPLLPLVIRVAIVTGLRKSALDGLTWADIDFAAGVARVARTKNGDEHVAPLTPDILAALTAVKPAHALPSHLIFGSRKNPNVVHNYIHAFARALKVAGIEGASLHTLRHTSCSRLAEAGRSLLEIAEHAGHRSMTMARRYSHLSTKGRASMVREVFA